MVHKEILQEFKLNMEEGNTAAGSDHEKATEENLKRPAPSKDAKNSRKKTKTEHVHLPTSDVRSNYHRIFETIFNGCQKSIATKHFRNVCIEDCVLVSRSINNPFGPNYREVRGIESMVEYVDTSLEAIPDCIFAILDTKFFRKPQAESMIISSYTVNGRIIYTIDSLDTEDIEDIDSAISGLQMLYQGGCGTGATDAVDAAHIVCSKVESAVSKEADKSSSKIGHSTSASDALYSFVYQPAAADTLTSRGSSFPTLNPSAGANGAASGNSVEPFDYSLKFTSTGASLFEASSNSEDNEDDDLALLGIGAATAGIAGIKARPATSNPTGVEVSVESKLRANTSAISLLADSSSDRIHQRLLTSASEDSNSGVTSSGASSSGSSTGASSSSTSFTNGTSMATATAMITLPKVHPEGIVMPTLSLSDISSTGSAAATTSIANANSIASISKEAFWNKHRSNVMIVKEQATFCLKERVPIGKQVYKVKGTLTLHLNADKKVKRIELLNSFDTSMHR